MTVGGAVCEFNPFHSGHKYFLNEIKKSGADGVVCVMSGNFVQRGETAVCDKYLRAEAAVRNGADLVLELPVPYAVGTAETFARGSVGILDSLGCVDTLFFGAESSLDDIMYTLNECETKACQDRIRSLLDSGLSYPNAVAMAVGNDILNGANNVLAIEYIRQLKKLKSEIKPVRIERIGAYHDEENERDGFLSASAVRERLRRGGDCRKYLPGNVESGEIADPNKLEIAVLSKLRTMSEEQLAQIADVNEGLEFRIKSAVQTATSVAELTEKIKTRRYTNAKIRRILLCAYLGVTKEMQAVAPSFVRVLATNEKGLEIIKAIKSSSDIDIICRHSDAENLSESDKMLYDFGNVCDDIFALALPEIRPCGYNQRRKFTVIKN